MAAKVRVFENEDELSTALAEYVSEVSEASVKERGYFAIALSGGPLISLIWRLTKTPYLKTMDWLNWQVFWAEEKVVPGEKDDTNYKQAEEFLSKVPIINSEQINPVSQSRSAELAADKYQYDIRQLVRIRTVDVALASDCPRFDLILLVLGPDGRVSSLYPNHPVLYEVGQEAQWVYPVSPTPQAPADAVTFSLPVINSAANVAIIATGEAVASSFASAFGRGAPSAACPAKLISLSRGELVWFVDEAAAAASKAASASGSSSSSANMVD